MAFRDRLFATLRAMRPLLAEPGVLIVGSEVKVKTIARQAAEDALAASLRNAITAQLTAQLTEEQTRVFSEPPVKEMLARVVRDTVGEVLASLDWGNGRPAPGFSKR